MSRPVTITDAEIAEAKRIIAKHTGNNQLFEALSVAITATTGATLDQVAEILGKSRETVVRLRRQFRHAVASGNPDTSVARGSGGRHRQLLSVEEEGKFLEPWAQAATTGQLLVLPPLHRALEERVGRRVAVSTTYAMLSRHGWRKIQPDTRHPKADEQAQETFKKSSRKSLRKPGMWLPPLV